MMHDRKYAKLPEVKEVNQCEASKKNIQPFIFRFHTENWIPQNNKKNINQSNRNFKIRISKILAEY